MLASVAVRSQRVLLTRGLSTASRTQGTVKWFDRKKGFGFINASTFSEDIFVHQSQVQSDGFRTLLGKCLGGVHPCCCINCLVY
ncbi:cold shock domain-containing protein [archaeon]|nr:MAG: cold shock domain-containing protein [archaeon]